MLTANFLVRTQSALLLPLVRQPALTEEISGFSFGLSCHRSSACASAKTPSRSDRRSHCGRWQTVPRRLGKRAWPSRCLFSSALRGGIAHATYCNFVEVRVPEGCGQEVGLSRQGSGSPAGHFPNRNRVILSPKGTRSGPCRLALRNAARSHGRSRSQFRGRARQPLSPACHQRTGDGRLRRYWASLRRCQRCPS